MGNLGKKRELVTDMKYGQVKYGGHIKRRNTLMKSVVGEQSIEDEREVYNDTSLKITSTDGRTLVSQ